jgi:protocatechuate 3,4-dioxygenase beta subunit
MKFIKYLLAMMITLPACAQGNSPELQQLEKELNTKSVSVSNVLADLSWMPFHSQLKFRELIKKHAPSGKIVIITAAEPGKKITVKCKVTGSNGLPVSGALVYAYQTSAQGWYSDTAAHILTNEGDMRHARLFGYVITDQNGEFEIATIQPAGYPQSDLPAHIHLSMWKDNKNIPDVPGELLFEDDERLTPERKKRALRDGYLTAANSGTAESPVYRYQFTLKL